MGDGEGDRRRWVRIPMSGDVRWQSGLCVGKCRLLNISPDGAAIIGPLSEALRIGRHVALEVELAPTLEWKITDDARILRRVA